MLSELGWLLADYLTSERQPSEGGREGGRGVALAPFLPWQIMKPLQANSRARRERQGLRCSTPSDRAAPLLCSPYKTLNPHESACSARICKLRGAFRAERKDGQSPPAHAERNQRRNTKRLPQRESGPMSTWPHAMNQLLKTPTCVAEGCLRLPGGGGASQPAAGRIGERGEIWEAGREEEWQVQQTKGWGRAFSAWRTQHR